MKASSVVFILAVTITANAASPPVNDPSADQRYPAAIRSFDQRESLFRKMDINGVTLDGNNSTSLRFESGRHQLLLSLPRVEPIETISILGSTHARFNVSVSNQNVPPGDQWQAILKDTPVAATWGKNYPINSSARYILIELNSPSAFLISEIGIYGKLPAVASGKPRYLSELWGSPKQPEITPINNGPVSVSPFKPGALGFPPRMPGVTTRMQIGPAAPLTRLGAAPTHPSVR